MMSNNHTLRFVRLVSAATTMAVSLVGASAQSPSAKAPKLHVHQGDNIRVFYRTEGEHAVDLTDRNQNAIPDQVEDTLIQTKAAQILFLRELGFPDPFQSARYQRVSFLDIEFRSKDSLKSNGKAYDEVRTFQRRLDPKDTRSLSIHLATSLAPSTNPTPAHEFFHVIQNGASFFKNRWYTEGTARWAQRPFGSDGPEASRPLGTWPPLPEKAALLFEMTYESAAHFWKPLVAQMDADGTIPDSDFTNQLETLTYSDGTKVLKNRNLPGWGLIRRTLQALDQADDAAFLKLAYPNWSEENQRSPKNNPFILEAISVALTDTGKPR